MTTTGVWPPCIQTDQTDCYNDSGSRIPCKGSGQDGAFNSGASWPNPRFIETTNTVTDRLTDLMWPKNAGLMEFPLSFAEAGEAIQEMNQSEMFGFSDWRLPERTELFSLISHATINPALPADNPFFNVFPGYYWTATLCARFVRQAWYVHLGGGRVVKGMKNSSYMVWPVRHIPESEQSAGGLAGPGESDNRFSVDRKTVLDRTTGLMWARNADIANGPVRWMDAFKIIEQINKNRANGYSDWRLPNIRELDSMTDMDRHSPAIAGCEIFENIQPFYWSSTTSVYDPAYAWTLYTEDGNLGVGYKSKPEFFVWCVREGILG